MGDDKRTDPRRVVPRLDAKPWGGQRLAAAGLSVPGPEPLGEVVATIGDALLAGGGTIAELMLDAPDAVSGERGRAVTGETARFPLLVKLIDAGRHLSVQLHPDDDAARPSGGVGKTEAWHVLDAAPGAVLFLGLRPEVDPAAFAAACRAGDAAAGAMLNRIPAVPGTTVLLPAGTVHALGAGVLVYEIQQPSEITYRLYDWGHLRADGRPRELHVDQALAVLDGTSRPVPIAPLAFASGAGRRQLLAACRYFAIERIALAAGERVPLVTDDSVQVVTTLRGEAVVESGEKAITLPVYQSAIVPASAGATRLRAATPAVAMRAWVPDLAHDVIAPLRAAGHGDDAIVALAGSLPDLRAEIDRRS